jgi:hypothetical protein
MASFRRCLKIKFVVGDMTFDPYDVKRIQLKSYLGEFFVKPDMSDPVWRVAKYCMGHATHSMFGFKFPSPFEMRQFALACLLSCGRQLSWVSYGSYFIVQKNLDNSILLTDYADYDVVFITHAVGTMRNSLMGEMLSQIGVLRGLRKTFFFDIGGYAIQNMACRVVTVREASVALEAAGLGRGSVSGGSPASEEFNI